MSNEVFGFFESKFQTDFSRVFKSLQERTGLGIEEIPVSELYGLAKEFLPDNQTGVTAFIIGDKPGKYNTTYLTDYVDYDPAANIGLPVRALDRLTMLIDLIIMLHAEVSCDRIVLAVTDSGYIEESVHVKVDNLLAAIIEEYSTFSSQNTVYNIVFPECSENY